MALEELVEDSRELERRGALIASDNSHSRNAASVPAERCVFLEEAVEPFPDPWRIDVFLAGLEHSLRDLPAIHRNLRSSLYSTEIIAREQANESTEEADLLAAIDPENPEATRSTIEHLLRHGLIVRDEDEDKDEAE